MPRTRPGVRGAVITGWGHALPHKTLTNFDLEQMLDTSHEWIVERTGIHERRIAEKGVGASVHGGADRRSIDRVMQVYEDAAVFGDDPVAMARRWVGEGGQFLHLVDLDGARGTDSVNRAAVAWGTKIGPRRRRPRSVDLSTPKIVRVSDIVARAFKYPSTNRFMASFSSRRAKVHK